MRKFNFKSYIAGALTATVLLPVAVIGADTTVDAILGKIQLLVNNKTVVGNTLLYNGTTYAPVRAIAEAVGAEITYNQEKAIVNINTFNNKDTAWANKVYALTSTKKVDIDRLIISNVNNGGFKFKFLNGSESIISGNATINGNTAECKIDDKYTIKFEIHGDEITVIESTKTHLAETSATFVHRTAMQINGEPTDKSNDSSDKKATELKNKAFENATYSNGSSENAKTLVISNVSSVNLKYQVIAANGKDIITEGMATVKGNGIAECKFTKSYTIRLTLLDDNVIELTETEQKLFPNGKISFYTIGN